MGGRKNCIAGRANQDTSTGNIGLVVLGLRKDCSDGDPPHCSFITQRVTTPFDSHRQASGGDGLRALTRVTA
ncbi:MAG TPA: hypothetical protein VFC07_05390, partial [Verrucomicrobiae bacterium]|nr:hypothetical protein [Verrucomicrobiae bacterium]